MIIKNKVKTDFSYFKQLPNSYQKIWAKCYPLLRICRPGDLDHAKETTRFILAYQGKLKLDLDILVPVALMHDIGHSAILSEHFKFITGPNKIMNGKLVHMLTGAKIAQEILGSIHYNSHNIREVVDIISMHDADQLKGVEVKNIYNTVNKKIFHDIDSLDRYTENRLEKLRFIYPNKLELLKLLNEFLNLFFYTEFKMLAKKRLKKLLK